MILVRHAEMGTVNRATLRSEARRARAAALGVCSRAARPRTSSRATSAARGTLTPLAAALGLEVVRSPAQDLDALAKIVTSAPAGETIVVAGHSNTVPALAAKLGVTLPDLVTSPQGPMLADDQYGRVFVLTLPPAGGELHPTVLELAY